MPSEDPLVSVIIPHQAGREILLRCLETLSEDPARPPLEIILVDNGSSDGSVEAAQERFPEIRVLALPRNQGYAGGCNRGIEAAHGEYVLLLNDDTELEPGCLAALVAAAEAEPSVGACQPKIRSLRDRSRFEYSGAAGGLMDIYGYPFSRGRLMSHVEEDRGQYDDPIEVFWASGVCMLIRRALLRETGAFDEVFFSYMEEIDLSWRIQLAGFRIVYVPEAIVYHIGGYSLDQRVLKRMYLNHRNSMIMLIKNYSARSLLWILPIRVLLELFILGGALLRNPRRSRAVIQSFGWLLRHPGTLRRLRADVQRRRRVPDAEIFQRLYLGMAPIWYFVFGIRVVPDLPDVDRVLHRPLPHASPPAWSPDAKQVVQPQGRDFLYAYLDQAPIAPALMRAIECRCLARLPFQRPILDVGCGDGTFARMLFNGVVVDAGIDADRAECERARHTRCYAEVRSCGVEALPYEPERFATVFSNCALQQVEDVETALREIHRVMRPEGRLYLTVPGPRCTRDLLGRRLLARLGLRSLAERYAALTLRLFKAETVVGVEVWRELLGRAGFAVEEHEPYLPRRAARIQELCLAGGVVSRLAKPLLGRSLVFPRLHRLKVRVYRRLLRRAYEERAEAGSGSLVVARKLGARAEAC